MRNKRIKIAAALAAPLLLGGWALFRPELLFIDQKVDARAVPASAKVEILAKGEFQSYAHETSGTAELVSASGKRYVRLSGFKTSNGPDVHLYLVKGMDASGSGVGRGFLDLGTLKGNIGDQDYELPANASPDEYGAVGIWCKRFSVDFGGATLTPMASMKTASIPLTLASFGEEIRVTGGKFSSGGMAELIERDGKRFLRVAGGAKGAHVWLAKAETLKPNQAMSVTKLDLGVLASGRPQLFPVPKEIDAWLYRTVALWASDKKKTLGIAELRSEQERKPMMLLLA